MRRPRLATAGGRHLPAPPALAPLHAPRGQIVKAAARKAAPAADPPPPTALAPPARHTRDNTIERSRKWLCSQKSLDHLSMKKVWKALFYAVWHSDGREVQRELATSIASVMHSLKPQMAILYASVFFWTMRNEWAGIDKHRLDKYCVLARQMQKHVRCTKHKQKCRTPTLTPTSTSTLHLHPHRHRRRHRHRHRGRRRHEYRQ